MSDPQKDLLLVGIEMIDNMIKELNSLKMELQIKLDVKKPDLPAPLPPPPPGCDLLKFPPNQIKLKTIDFESSVLGAHPAHSLLRHTVYEPRPVTAFDIEVKAAVKRARAVMDEKCETELDWDKRFGPPAKKKKTEFEIRLENEFKRRNGILDE